MMHFIPSSYIPPCRQIYFVVISEEMTYLCRFVCKSVSHRRLIQNCVVDCEVGQKPQQNPNYCSINDLYYFV